MQAAFDKRRPELNQELNILWLNALLIQQVSSTYSHDKINPMHSRNTKQLQLDKNILKYLS